MAIKKILPGILLLILLFGVILYILGLGSSAAFIILIFLPLTIIYFNVILLKNYKAEIDSKIRWAIWCIAYVTLASVALTFVFHLMHWPFGGIFGLFTLLCAFILFILILSDIFVSSGKKGIGVTSYSLLLLPVIFITYRYLPPKLPDESAKMQALIERSNIENQLLEQIIGNEKEDTLSTKAYDMAATINQIKMALIMTSGGVNENGKTVGGSEKTATEIIMIGPEGVEKGEAYELYKTFQAEFPELVGKEIPGHSSEFVNEYFRDRSVLEALYELNYLKKIIFLHTLKKQTKSSH